MMTTRRVEPADLDAVYEVCLRTGDAGRDATALHSNRRLLGEVYVGPYVMLSGGIGFVPVDDEGVGGYVLGAADTRRFEAECEAEWWPPLRRQHPDPGLHPATPDEELISTIHRPATADDAVVGEYPAHLHIDLLPRMQGRGIGRKLMELMMSTLRAEGAVGVHLDVDVRNEAAIGFYLRLGFVELTRNHGAVTMGFRLSPVAPPGGGSPGAGPAEPGRGAQPLPREG